MQHFKTVVSNDALLSGNSFPIVASRGLSISWLQKWMVIVACHHWCIKLRHIRDMPETLLVVRDGNGNCNSSLTFLFTIWDHPRIPRVSKNMNALGRRKSNNGKRTRKRTRPICSSGARGWNVVNSWKLFIPRSSRTSLCSLCWWFSTRFPQYQKRNILRGACWSSLQYSSCLSSLSFLYLTLLLHGYLLQAFSNYASHF